MEARISGIQLYCLLVWTPSFLIKANRTRQLVSNSHNSPNFFYSSGLCQVKIAYTIFFSTFNFLLSFYKRTSYHLQTGTVYAPSGGTERERGVSMFQLLSQRSEPSTVKETNYWCPLLFLRDAKCNKIED